jgi:hypothetical protein
MGSLQSAHSRSENRDIAHSPAACVVLTILIATVFWAGLIWAAVRLYG